MLALFGTAHPAMPPPASPSPRLPPRPPACLPVPPPASYREELRVEHGPHHDLLHQPLGRLLTGNVIPADGAGRAVQDLIHHLGVGGGGGRWRERREGRGRRGPDELEELSRISSTT